MAKPLILKKEVPQVVEVIYIASERRGSGKSNHDPVRIVEQVFDLDGNLIMEHDPYGTLTVEDVISVIRHRERGDSRSIEEMLTAHVQSKNHKPF